MHNSIDYSVAFEADKIISDLNNYINKKKASKPTKSQRKIAGLSSSWNDDLYIDDASEESLPAKFQRDPKGTKRLWSAKVESTKRSASHTSKVTNFSIT